MKIEEIKRYDFLGVDAKASEQSTGEFVRYSDVYSMHNLLTEVCESLILQTGQADYCYNCGTWLEEDEHKNDCPVLKAQKYLQENKA